MNLDVNVEQNHPPGLIYMGCHNKKPGFSMQVFRTRVALLPSFGAAWTSYLR
uniref:Uncharacterized protein n=1 Tax=Kalanchoe fedtschenkoi TaxID=63787 RepID=A0A7N0TJ92_KALFE